MQSLIVLLIMLSSSIQAQIERNKIQRRWLGWDTEFIAKALNVKPVVNEDFIRSVVSFQNKNGLYDDGIIGPETLFRIELSTLPANKARIHLLAYNVIRFETRGIEHLVTANLEYKMPKNKAYKKTFTGISAYGVQFNQDYRSLCKVVLKFRKVDRKKFKNIFGPNRNNMLKVICRKGRSGRDFGLERGIRVQKIKTVINGKTYYYDTWDSYWKNRFINAGKYYKFKFAAREMAYYIYLRPYEKKLVRMGFSSDKSMAIAFNISVHFGPAKIWKFFNRKCNFKTCEKFVLRKIAKKYYRARIILKDERVSF